MRRGHAATVHGVSGQSPGSLVSGVLRLLTAWVLLGEAPMLIQFLQSHVQDVPAWTWPCLAVGAGVGGLVAALSLLVRMARDVLQGERFVWLCPLVAVAVGFALDARADATLLQGVELQHFTLFVVGAFVAGGALLRTGGWFGALSGLAVLALPLSTLWLSLVRQHGTVEAAGLALRHLTEGQITCVAAIMCGSVAIVGLAISGRGRNMAPGTAGSLHPRRREVRSSGGVPSAAPPKLVIGADGRWIRV